MTPIGAGAVLLIVVLVGAVLALFMPRDTRTDDEIWRDEIW